MLKDITADCKLDRHLSSDTAERKQTNKPKPTKITPKPKPKHNSYECTEASLCKESLKNL